MDINKYKFYVRDVSVTDEQLQMLLQDVVNDIAVSTKIFKRLVGVIIDPDIKEYNFKNIYEQTIRLTNTRIENLTIADYSNDTLVEFLKDPNSLSIDTTVEKTVSIPDTFIDVVDVLGNIYTDDSTPLGSIFYKFDRIGVNDYKFVENIKESKNALCIVNVIPALDNIDEQMESYMKMAIVAGLKYYTETQVVNQNLNYQISSYKVFENAKNQLQGLFPTYIGQQMKRSIL